MKKFATLSIAALATLSFAACANEPEPSTAPAISVSPEAPAPAEKSETAEAPTASEPASDSTIAAAPAEGPGSADDAAAAREAALAHVGEPGVVIAQDLEDDKATWDVDVLVGDKLHEIKVVDGKAKSDEVEDADDEDRAAAKASTDVAAAIDAALADAPGTLDDISWDDGGYWDVEIDTEDGDDVELTVDPATGEVSRG